MSSRSQLTAAAVLALALTWFGAPVARSQADGQKQALVVHYPNPAIMIDGTTRYGGLIYVKVYAAGQTAAKLGTKPVATSELGPSQRDIMNLPVGEYEVHFGMRKGSVLYTFIKRDVLLRTDGRGTSLMVEMNSAAKTTIIGGDMTAQEMADGVRSGQKEIAALKAELASIRKK